MQTSVRCHCCQADGSGKVLFIVVALGDAMCASELAHATQLAREQTNMNARRDPLRLRALDRQYEMDISTVIDKTILKPN